MSQQPPRTPRGEATRRAILDAARALFAERGFHRTTVPDIVKAAGVGHGTYYEYFSNRRDVLLELVKEAGAQSEVGRSGAGLTLAERVRVDIRAFLRGYVSNIDLSKIWTEAAAFDEGVAESRKLMRAPLIKGIRRIVEAAGRPGLDPAMTAVALAAMTEQFAYLWFVEGLGPGCEEEHVDEAAVTLARLWGAAIGLTAEEARV